MVREMGLVSGVFVVGGLLHGNCQLVLSTYGTQPKRSGRPEAMMKTKSAKIIPFTQSRIALPKGRTVPADSPRMAVIRRHNETAAITEKITAGSFAK